MTRLYPGRQKVVTRYRSYHGATFGGMTTGGNSRRLATLDQVLTGAIHYWEN